MNAPGVGHLVDRHPTVSAERLVSDLVPPPTFATVSLDGYRPDPAEPSQAAAVQACKQFIEVALERRAGRKRLLRKPAVLPGAGLYLDGGFGVGKTHLLASMYFALQNAYPKAYATFSELTQLASVFGYLECIDILADYVMVCIDEFELDDPGNTTLISRLLSQLVARGVSVAATSNTLPEQLGEGGSPQRTSSVKPARWQAFSRPCGSRGPTTGIVRCRRRPSRRPTTTCGAGPRPSPARPSTTSTRCAITSRACIRPGFWR
jgi:predicted ATPase